MTNYKKILGCLFTIAIATAPSFAQSNGCNSSYSRFGLGTLSDQAQGFNKGMGGAGIAFRSGNRLNMSNPASYSAIDSLTFLMDVGLTASTGQMKSGNSHVNVTNGCIDYASLGFQLARGLGMTAGFAPFSTIGYSFSNESNVSEDYTSSQMIRSKSKYGGNGGIHQMYIGLGWRPFANLSVGANFSYLWGKYDHEFSQSFYEGINSNSSSNYSGLNATHDADIRTYKLDFGVQYPIRLNNQNWLNIGATAGIGHEIKSDATLTRYTSAGDSLQVVAKNAFELPYTFGVGLSWQHKDRLVLVADYKQERWANCQTPIQDTSNGELTYTPQTGAFLNRSKFAIGAQFTPAPEEKGYFKRIQYRLGANYSTPYLVVNGHDGPKEYGVSAGFGLPISNQINKGTVVNFSVQWLRRAPSVSTQITENYFMFTLGATFSERWFMKFKIE